MSKRRLNKKEAEHVSKVRQKINQQMNKFADKIVVSQHIPKKEPKREEGEFWYDDEGKQWTMKNGIKQSISPLEAAKTPWWCPECGKPLSAMDTKVWRKKGFCHDCLSMEETKVKLSGEWAKHIEKKKLANNIAYLTDRIVELTYYYETLSTPEIMHFDDKTGTLLMVDRYAIPIDKVKKDIQEEVVSMNKRLKEMEAEYEEKFNEVAEESKDS